MVTIGVVSSKGGAAKTATCINLATAAALGGYATAVVDCDRQASASEWSADREGKDYPLVAQIEEGAVAETLPGLLEEARANGIQAVFIDTAPRFVVDIEAVIRASDLILLTSQPRIADIRGIRPAVNMIFTAGAAERTRALLTICPPRIGFSLNPAVADAQRVIERDFQLSVCPVTITRYEDVPSAWTVGQGVAEFAPRGKSATEWLALWRYLEKTLGLARPIPAKGARKARTAKAG